MKRNIYKITIIFFVENHDSRHHDIKSNGRHRKYLLKITGIKRRTVRGTWTNLNHLSNSIF